LKTQKHAKRHQKGQPGLGGHGRIGPESGGGTDSKSVPHRQGRTDFKFVLRRQGGTDFKSVLRPGPERRDGTLLGSRRVYREAHVAETRAKVAAKKWHQRTLMGCHIRQGR
jgi:hypothetical protein